MSIDIRNNLPEAIMKEIKEHSEAFGKQDFIIEVKKFLVKEKSDKFDSKYFSDTDSFAIALQLLVVHDNVKLKFGEQLKNTDELLYTSFKLLTASDEFFNKVKQSTINIIKGNGFLFLFLNLTYLLKFLYL